MAARRLSRVSRADEILMTAVPGAMSALCVTLVTCVTYVTEERKWGLVCGLVPLAISPAHAEKRKARALQANAQKRAQAGAKAVPQTPTRASDRAVALWHPSGAGRACQSQ